MVLSKGKHIVKEIDGLLCTVVEAGISMERMKFLKELLEFNKFEVKIEEEKAKIEAKVEANTAATFTIGVTDLVFNPMIAVYEHRLKKPDGETVSPAYWNQQKEIPGLPYFEYREKNPNAVNEDDFIPVTHAYSTV